MDSVRSHPCAARYATPRAGATSSDDWEQEDLALGRFADLYATGQIPEYHKVVDTISAWGEEIPAYHTLRRTSRPVEGINNLLQVLRRVAHGFTNPDSFAARGILVTLILVGSSRWGRV